MRKLTLITLAVIMIIAMVLTLTACADGNIATEAVSESTASPTPESTASPTPEPTPEPEEPPHEHIWQDANFQQPLMCIECCETEGEPIPPRFEEYGFTLSEHGVQVPYITALIDDFVVVGSTVGQITVTNYEVFDLGFLVVDFYDGLEKLILSNLDYDWRHNPNHDITGISSVDGYFIDEDWEWRLIDFEIEFTDRGFTWFFGLNNYYTLDLSKTIVDDSGVVVLSVPDTLNTLTLNYNGNEYDSWSYYTYYSTGWINGVNTQHLQYKVFVPVGYDGIMMVFMNGGSYLTEPLVGGDIIDEDTVFFRIG